MAQLRGQEQVEEYLHQLEHPLKKVIEEVRSFILSVDDRITEHIKWNAPSFCVQGEDRITLNLQGKGFIRLIFHCGAKVKDHDIRGTLTEDTAGLLEWASQDRAIVKIVDTDDLEQKKEQLKAVIARWIEVTS
ncbi:MULTISPECIES: DUF1801 domain-containing protein [Bacillales]|uniref:DUF1801 domain-containing protein n=1 Tax=Bacillales TaxID=1385 RepID=UPI00017885DD|nr:MULTISPECIES: DUF1801 domain-containing protein [Paenibacillus]ACX66667.1 Domain of unknown function DUF1801 [Paenibacillus sp. Y412MC10]MCM3259137.1 DUF1801 domain-containing protein [Paenibacillus lautus]